MADFVNYQTTRHMHAHTCRKKSYNLSILVFISTIVQDHDFAWTGERYKGLIARKNFKTIELELSEMKLGTENAMDFYEICYL